MTAGLTAALMIVLAQQPDDREREGRTPPTAEQLADAYVDEVARELVAGARARRSTVDWSIERYRALAQERGSAGLRTLGRDRTLFRREVATRIDWRRDGPVELEVLGAREVLPAIQSHPQIPAELRGFVPRLAFDPVESEILLRVKDGFIRHPLAEGAEAHYRFRTGEITTIRLPSGRDIRLRELEVIPRRREVHLISGSFWLEEGTHAVVQAVFKLADAFDLERDEDDDDMEDVPGVFKPIRFDLEYITIEYGLWDLRWWMPRYMAAEGLMQMGSMIRMPFEYAVRYSEYEVFGDTAAVREAFNGDREGRLCTPPGNFSLKVSIGGDDEERAREEAERARRAGRPPRMVTPDAQDDDDEDVTRDRCGRQYVVRLPDDTTELIHSTALPPAAFGEDTEWLATRAQLRDLADRIQGIEEAPWRVGTPTFSYGLKRAGLIRYNRVEALSIGAQSNLDLGRLQLDGTARLGVADLRPNVELGVSRESRARSYRLAGYRRLTMANPDENPFGFGNSFNALLLGRDAGEYYMAAGADFTMRPALIQKQWYALRLFAERQSPATRNTNVSLPHLFDGDRDFRSNILADRADQFGGALTLSHTYGENPAAFRWGATLGVEAAGGDYEYIRPKLTLRSSFPLPGALMASLEGSAGTSSGPLPRQSEWILGGASTLRGYESNAASGAAFWLGRAEIATSLPAARIGIFSDAGWAGPVDGFSSGRALMSVGVGVSMLDGLLRLDLAKALDGDRGLRLHSHVTPLGM